MTICGNTLRDMCRLDAGHAGCCDSNPPEHGKYTVLASISGSAAWHPGDRQRFMHLYLVDARDSMEAQKIVRADVLPGFELTVLAMWIGHHESIIPIDHKLIVHNHFRKE